MKTKLAILGGAAILTVAGIVAIAAQRHQSAGASTTSISEPALHFLQAACGHHGDVGGQSDTHVPAHLAKALELTDAQLTEIDRIAAEACTVVKQVHHDILNVLTPEQQRKVRELHGRASDHSSMPEWVRKLHGK